MIFVCLRCGKRQESQGFPYGEGWVYVYGLNGQVGFEGRVRRFNKKDLHFCSRACFVEYAYECAAGRDAVEVKL